VTPGGKKVRKESEERKERKGREERLTAQGGFHILGGDHRFWTLENRAALLRNWFRGFFVA